MRFQQKQSRVTEKERIPSLTLEEELELGHRCVAGDMEARHELASRNLWLSRIMAPRFATNSTEHFDDLVAEGYAGIFHATSKWRPGKHRFSTFAKSWVAQYMAVYIMDKRDVIRIPVYLHKIRSKLSRKVSIHDWERAAWANKSRYDSPNMVSTEYETESGSRLSDSIASHGNDPTYMAEVRDSVEVAMSVLTPRQRDVVHRRVGSGETFASIGQIHGVTQSGAIHIFMGAMDEIRQNQERKAS